MSGRAPADVRGRLLAQLDDLDGWVDGPAGRSLPADLLRRHRALLQQAGPGDVADVEVGLAAELAALAAVYPGVPLLRPVVAGAVRTSLARLAARHPGHLVEVRVPPHGAVQIGKPGVAGGHKRGTPPNVVETDALTWLRLTGGSLSWPDAVAASRVSASGVHAELDDLLPLR